MDHQGFVNSVSFTTSFRPATDRDPDYSDADMGPMTLPWVVTHRSPPRAETYVTYGRSERS